MQDTYKILDAITRQDLPIDIEQGDRPAPYDAGEGVLGYNRKNNMRNMKCPCGSGKKFKKCCWGKYIR